MQINSDSKVCPESTLESANRNDNSIKKTARMGANNNNTLACESTIESSLRRDFIKKAALVTAVAGISSTALVRNVIPQSSASSAACTNLRATCNVFVNTASTNNGCCLYPGLIFGCTGSGEGIGSKKTCGGNQYGLDFYTAKTKRMSITNFGFVGIGTCSPLHSLDVSGSIRARGGTGLGVIAFSCCSQAIEAFAKCGAGVVGCSNTVGVRGIGRKTAGVSGFSVEGPGVCGTNCQSGGHGIFPGVAGTSLSGNIGVLGRTQCAGIFAPPSGVLGTARTGIGVTGESCSGIGLFGVACGPGAKPIVAQGDSGQTAHLQEWQNSLGTALSVVDANGHFGVRTATPATPLQVVGTASATKLGLGTTAPKTTLQVGGSVSARVVSLPNISFPSSYTMGASDFAALINASSTAFTVTLPPAKTAAGMVVFIKKSDSSGNAVTIARNGSTTDRIEAKTSITLKKQYDSLQLISNGTNEWFILGNAKCGLFIS